MRILIVFESSFASQQFTLDIIFSLFSDVRSKPLIHFGELISVFPLLALSASSIHISYITVERGGLLRSRRGNLLIQHSKLENHLNPRL